jgi:hypothetical protein
MTFTELHAHIISLPDQDILPIGSKVPVKSHWWANAQRDIVMANDQHKVKQLKECQLAKYRMENILKQITVHPPK